MERARSYLRTFPELFPKVYFLKEISEALRKYLGTFLFLYFAILILVLCGILLLSYSFYVGAAGSFQAEQEYLAHWEEVVTLYPNYPDAYYNAAYFAARTGEARRALQYVESALYLDSDFSEAKNLREEILEMK